MTEQTEQTVDVEAIMAQIREEILAQKQAQMAGEQLTVHLGGKRFSEQFYEYLYHANMAYDQIQVSLQVQKSTVPVIGPFIDRLRMAIHQVVLFYVQQLADNQLEVNKQFMQAFNQLVKELDDELEAQS